MSSLALACMLLVGTSEASPEPITYRVRPIPAADRTDLEICVRFQSLGHKPLVVGLPADRFGTPNLYQYVRSFEGEGGTIVQPGKDKDQRLVQPGDDGECRLRYVLSYDPRALADISYAPHVDPQYFHVTGCQWLLRLGDPSQKRRYVVEMHEAPMGWHLYSSVAPNPSRFEVTSDYNDLAVNTALGGGAGYFNQFLVRSKPVSVFLEGDFPLPKDEVFQTVKRIVELERDWFSDYEQPFYHVTMLPKADHVAGMRIKNLFLCLIKPDITREQLSVLVAHEMFHNWLTEDLIKPPKEETTLRYLWFYEGFTDYFARRLLADSGLLTKERFAYLINRDIINIADNPHRTIPYADAAKASWDTALTKLFYYRGALIALNWDHQIRKAGTGRQLGDLIRDVCRRVAREGPLTEPAFFAEAARYGIDVRSDFERYILQGKPITLAPDALGNGFSLRECSTPSFDPSFSMRQSRRTRQIAGVVDNGPAYRAGLRDGMSMVDMENYNRFSNAWDPNRPMAVTVRSDVHERRFEFLPRGAPSTLLLFRSDH